MVITEITGAKNHLCKICFDNSEDVFLDKETVAKNALKAGLLIDEERLEELKYESALARATSKAMWLLSRREYSQKEMIFRLKRDKFDENAIFEAVKTLADAGVIDDERFAYNYAYSLKMNRKLGYRAIVTELIRKGVSREMAEEYAAQFSQDDTDDAVKIIKLKYATFSTDEKVKRRMIAALQRKGYNYDAIKHAMEMFEGD